MSSGVADFDTLPIVNASRLLLGVLSTAGNLFILALFFYSSKLRKYACTLLIALLCISNVLVGIGLLIRATYSIVAEAPYYKKSTCYGVNSLIGIGKTASEIVILGIAIDRFNAVYKPVIYSKNEKNHWLILQTIIAAIIMSFALTWAKQLEVDNSILITVCTAAAATGPYSFLVTTCYTGIFLIILYSVYALSFLLLINKTQTSNLQTKFKIQKKFFVSVSLIILCYSIFYGIPFLGSLATVIFKLAPSIKAYITLFSGLSSGLNSTIDVIIYLTKNDEIKKAAIQFLSKCFPRILQKQKHFQGVPSIGTSVAANIKSHHHSNSNFVYIS